MGKKHGFFCDIYYCLGQGTLVMGTWGEYKGDFDNGEIHGIGTRTYHDGSQYTGLVWFIFINQKYQVLLSLAKETAKEF